MCPFVILTMFLSFFIFLIELTVAISMKISPSSLNTTFAIIESDRRYIQFFIEDTERSMKESQDEIKIISENPDIATIENETYIVNEDNKSMNISFILKGNFMGITRLKLKSPEGDSFFEVRVKKLKQAITFAFTTCVIILMSITYVNMGCALDLDAVKSVLMKPIAPCLGFISQYLFMPLTAYCLARILFTDVILQLGLFMYACSPGGGASNMWTVLLKGNLNLSLTMTFISNLAALGMVPLWIFMLGRTLFSEMTAKVPYNSIFRVLGMMLITLAIGVAIQKYLPRVAKICQRALAPFSIFMILVIIVFGTYANLYMFKLFTWQIILAAAINVWLGFLFGAIAARIIKLPKQDIIAIAIETGIQNTGIAFVLLQVSLQDPEKDLAAVVPVAASIMTPIPLLLIYFVQFIRDRFYKKSQKEHSYILNDSDEKKYMPAPSSADPIIIS